jgi:histidinol-phosphate aminotransferase
MSSDALARAHGGMVDDELRALRIDPDSILDLSVNVNPYGPSPAVLEAIRRADVSRYPDPTASPARRAIADRIGVPHSSIVLGNGAVDLIWTAARAILSPGDSALVVEPAFSEFGAAARSAGARVVAWRAEEETGFAVDLDALGATVAEERAAMVYLCSPANPTGVTVEPDAIDRFARAHSGVTVLFDQAFASLSESPSVLDRRFPPNVLCLRSMTKEHAIPGIRVGYAHCRPEVARRLERARPPWSTSSLAAAAAMAAIRDEAFIAESRSRVLADRRRLTERLRAAGLAPLPTTTLYFLLPVPDATVARERLLRRARVLVRDCTSFGLPRMVRVCARPPPDDDRLIAALTQELRECSPARS